MAEPAGGPAEPTGAVGTVAADTRTVLEVAPRSILLAGAAVIGISLILGAIRAAPATLTQIAIGAIIALALDPVVVKVRTTLKWRRANAVALVMAVVAVVFATLLAVMGPPAISQARQFADELPETVREMYDFPVVGERLREADAANEVEEWAAELPARIDGETIGRVMEGLVGGLAATVTVLLVAVALLIDGDALTRRFRRLLPEERRDAADRAGRIFYQVIGRYFAGSLLVAGIAGTFVLALGLVMGVPLAPLAAIWVFITDLIPQVGGFLGGAVFVTLAVTQSVTIGVIAAVLFIVYLQVENHILQPAIVGERVDLSPPVTMLAALTGGAAAGVPGALIATPLLGTIKALYLEYRGRQPVVGTQQAEIEGEEEDEAQVTADAGSEAHGEARGEAPEPGAPSLDDE